MSEPPQYVLQSEREELERLVHQSRALEPATRLHLGLSGIGPGMRVLDLGATVMPPTLVGAFGRRAERSPGP